MLALDHFLLFLFGDGEKKRSGDDTTVLHIYVLM